MSDHCQVPYFGGVIFAAMQKVLQYIVNVSPHLRHWVSRAMHYLKTLCPYGPV
jgi:hypothetical protein